MIDLARHLPLVLAAVIGASTSFIGAYLSYFLDGATGGVIVCLQTAIPVAKQLAVLQGVLRCLMI